MTSLSTPAVQLRTDAYAQSPAPGQSYIVATHVLQANETIRQVAEAYNISPASLLQANPQLWQILQSGQLRAGIVLNIPASQAAIGVAPGARAFDVPRSSVPNPVPGVVGSALTPPANGGVSLAQPYAPTPSRTFYADPDSGASPPTRITWPAPRLLAYGMRPSTDVETLQRALARLGYTVRPDGSFGPATDAAVRNFQTLVGLPETGATDPNTWDHLKSAVDAVTTPSQILVSASRDQFQSYDERNAYDILVALAYDDPGQVTTSTTRGYGLRELLRVIGQPVGTPTRITAESVTALATACLNQGLPLNDEVLAPLQPLQAARPGRPTYHEARAICDFYTQNLVRSSSLTRNHTYDALITSVARQYQVPPELVKAVMSCESNFDPSSVSPTDAQGLMQVEPGTAAFVGVPDTSTPQANVIAGVRYLAWLLRRYNGNVVFTIAGYNAGPARVDRTGDVPPIQETYDYVRRVLVAYAYYLQHPPQGV